MPRSGRESSTRKGWTLPAGRTPLFRSGSIRSAFTILKFDSSLSIGTSRSSARTTWPLCHGTAALWRAAKMPPTLRPPTTARTARVPPLATRASSRAMRSAARRSRSSRVPAQRSTAILVTLRGSPIAFARPSRPSPPARSVFGATLLRSSDASEEPVTRDDRRGEAGEVTDQAGGERVASVADTGRTEVDREDVEGRLGRALQRAGEEPDEGVGSVRLQGLAHHREGPGPRQRAEERHRQDLGRDAERPHDRGEERDRAIERTGCAQHADRDQDRDEIGDDPDRDV